jgi:hypothetical protein
MSFTSINLVSPDKDIKKAKETLVQNVKEIIGYDPITRNAKNETTLTKGIEYLKFVEEDLKSKLEMLMQYKQLQRVNKTKLTVNNRSMHNATMESLKPFMNDVGKKEKKFFEELIGKSKELYEFLDNILKSYKQQQQHQQQQQQNNSINKKTNGKARNKKTNNTSGKGSGKGNKSRTQKNYSRPSRGAAAAAYANNVNNANAPLKHQLKRFAIRIADFVREFVDFYGDEDNLKPGGYGIPYKYKFKYIYRGHEGVIPMSVQKIAGDGACGIRAFLTGVMYIISKKILPYDPPSLPEFIRKIKVIMLDFLIYLNKIPDNEPFLRASIYGNPYNLTEEQQKAKYILTHDEYAGKLLIHNYEFTIEELEVMCTLINLAAPNVYQLNVFISNALADTVYDSKTVRDLVEFPSNKHINILYKHGGSGIKHGHYDFIVDPELPEELKNYRENFFKLTLPKIHNW